MWEGVFLRDYCKDFAKEYKNSWENINNQLNSLDNNTLIRRLFKRLMARHSFATKIVREGEIMCIDEGLYQLAVSIGYRSEPRSLPPLDYFDVIPTPDSIIMVDVSNMMSKDRQQGRKSVKREGQFEELQASYDRVCEIAEQMGITVNTISNEGTIDQTIKEIHSYVC